MNKLLILLMLIATPAYSMGFPMSGNPVPVYGEIYAIDAASDTVVDADLRETPVTAFAVNGESNGVTPSHTSDILTFSTAGKYFIAISTSTTGTGNSTEMHVLTVLNHGSAEGANSKFLAAPDCDATCATNDIITATHGFSNGDIVYLDTATGYTNVVVNTEYYVCEVTGTASFGLTDNVAGAGIDCDAGAATQIVLTAEDPAGTFRGIGTKQNNVHAHRSLGATALAGSISLSGIIDVAVGDTLGVLLHTDSSTQRTYVVGDITLTAIKMN